MPVSRDQFDADLAAYNTAVTDYIAAVTAFLALPPVIDLANEDASVQTALAAVQAAQAQLPPPPPGP
jgi:hypothetical protein